MTIVLSKGVDLFKYPQLGKKVNLVKGIDVFKYKKPFTPHITKIRVRAWYNEWKEASRRDSSFTLAEFVLTKHSSPSWDHNVARRVLAIEYGAEIVNVLMSAAVNMRRVWGEE